MSSLLQGDTIRYKKVQHQVELARMQCINNEKVDVDAFRELIRVIIPEVEFKPVIDDIIDNFNLLKISMSEKYNY